jgi:hypothetical protein
MCEPEQHERRLVTPVPPSSLQASINVNIRGNNGCYCYAQLHWLRLIYTAPPHIHSSPETHKTRSGPGALLINRGVII